MFILYVMDPAQLRSRDNEGCLLQLFVPTERKEAAAGPAGWLG